MEYTNCHLLWIRLYLSLIDICEGIPILFYGKICIPLTFPRLVNVVCERPQVKTSIGWKLKLFLKDHLNKNIIIMQFIRYIVSFWLQIGTKIHFIQTIDYSFCNFLSITRQYINAWLSKTAAGGERAMPPSPQILADQLTLSQSGG